MLHSQSLYQQPLSQLTDLEKRYKAADRQFVKSFEKGFILIRQLAELGFPLAIYRLGKCYLYGHGIPQDTTKAIRILKEAADKGVPRATFILSEAYWKTDPAKAAFYCLQAAMAGEPDSQLRIAVCYRDGIGVEIDNDKALHWFHMAHASGCQGCQEAIRLLTKPDRRPPRPRKIKRPSLT